MYEVSYAGFLRSPNELEKYRKNKLYRLKINWNHFYQGIIQGRWYKYELWNNFLDVILNRKSQ